MAFSTFKGIMAASGHAAAPAGPANIISNGTFNDGSVWGGAGFSGKTISGGTANFSSSPTYDGFTQSIAPTAGKYYELQWTVLNYSSGVVYPFISGGTVVTGANRSAAGIYTERLLIASGNNLFGFQLSTSGTMSVDNITLIGPYNTATIGGA